MHSRRACKAGGHAKACCAHASVGLWHNVLGYMGRGLSRIRWCNLPRAWQLDAMHVLACRPVAALEPTEDKQQEALAAVSGGEAGEVEAAARGGISGEPVMGEELHTLLTESGPGPAKVVWPAVLWEGCSPSCPPPWVAAGAAPSQISRSP
jgi:hypothetical protein